MDVIDHYSAKLSVITSIPDDRIMEPTNIPISVYIQEAEDLFTWCKPDKEKFIANGLQWSLVEDLPARIDTLREAQARWENSDLSDMEIERIWDEKLPEAQELRKDLIRSLKFVFYKDNSRLDKIEKFSDGGSHAAMIQSLRGMVIFSRENIEALKAGNFDVSKIERAEVLSHELGSILSEIHSIRANCSGSKKIRNQAYTHLKEATTEVKRHADFLLLKDQGRLKGYTSTYTRKRYQKSKNKKGNPKSDEVTE